MAQSSITAAPVSPLAPPNSVALGLRRPSDRFALKSSFFSLRLQSSPSSMARFSMRVASKKAYICRDCGYIYKDRTPFEKLPDKYFCPVCGAPKRRFRPYEPAVAKNANDTDVRKARKARIQRDETIGRALPIAAAIGAAALVGLYFYVSAKF